MFFLLEGYEKNGVSGKRKKGSVQKKAEPGYPRIKGEKQASTRNKGKITYDARADWNGGGLTVLSPHAVMLPGVDISVSVEDRDNDKLELVKEAGDLLVLAVA